MTEAKDDILILLVICLVLVQWETAVCLSLFVSMGKRLRPSGQDKGGRKWLKNWRRETLDNQDDVSSLPLVGTTKRTTTD